MGGGTSKFNDTDWSRASGRLRSGLDTIDGNPPTPSYAVYYLQKRAVNQRDYDVTDADANLLYTTRYIGGTLAWFDVLGRGMDEYLLRVQVDISRRYWVVYRYGCPTYAGQFADLDATSRLRGSRGDDQPCLFKRCCITVTWARFHAIVNNYGPSPTDHELELKKTISSSNSSSSMDGEEVVVFDDGKSTTSTANSTYATDHKTDNLQSNAVEMNGDTEDRREASGSTEQTESNKEDGETPLPNVPKTTDTAVKELSSESANDSPPTTPKPLETVENKQDTTKAKQQDTETPSKDKEEKVVTEGEGSTNDAQAPTKESIENRANDLAPEKEDKEKESDAGSPAEEGRRVVDKVGNDDDEDEASDVKDNNDPAKTQDKGDNEPPSSSSSSSSSSISSDRDWIETTGVEESKDELDDETAYNGTTTNNKKEEEKGDDKASLFSNAFEKTEITSFHFADENGNPAISSDLDNAAVVAHVPSSRRKQFKRWLKKRAAATMSLIPSPPNPLEGELQLDDPILKCEEINSIMGQHQTMLVGKEEAKILKKEELEEAKKAGTDAYRPESVIHGPVTAAPPPAQTSPSDPKTFPRIRKFANWVKTKSRKRLDDYYAAKQSPTSGGKTASFDSVDNFAHSNMDNTRLDELKQQQQQQKQERQEPPDTSNLLPQQQKPSPSSSPTAQHHQVADKPTASDKDSNEDGGDDDDDDDDKEQPLVGFWSWENTVRVHKIKMHVAEGSDLALHVVLAIVTNQLRLERNVLVTTV